MLAKLTTLKGVLLLFVLAFSLPALAQKRIDGKVTGPDGKPVYGATVTVKGTNVATSTNGDGAYSITIPGNETTLVFSYVGYEVYEIEARGTNLIDVTMKAQTTSLNEVVVTGYSSQRKKDITGAVTVVNVADLKAIPSANATGQLQGRASGVTVVQNGVPGADAKVRVRGMGSFSNNSPLFVVDGVQTGSISGLSPTDIESIQVLKDAASAAIYGVRGSNGVIVVTTKKGKKRGVAVSYDMYYGSQDPGKGFELLNAQEEGELSFLMRKNSGLPTTGSVYGNGSTPTLPDYIFYTGSPNSASVATPIMNGNPGVDPSKYTLNYGLLGDPGYSPYIIVPANKSGTNWFKEATRNAPIQNHNLTLSGAGEASRFMFSLNYFNQQAITNYQFYKRYTARLNSEFTVLKVVRIGENIQVLGSEANVPGNDMGGDNNNNQEAGIIAQTFRPMSIIPVYTIVPGDFAGTRGGSGFGTWGNAKNPVAQEYRKRNDRNNNINLFGNAYAEVDIAKHFTARTSFGGYINTNNAFSYPWIEYEHVENTANNAYTENFVRSNNWIWTNQVTYKNSFGKHDVAVLAGHEAQKGGGRQIIASGTNYYSYNYQPFINLNNGNIWKLGGSTIYTPGTLESWFAKADYAFDGKYIVSGTIRRDASSKFLDPNKWGTFPAVSVGWRISDESFMKGISWLNDLKIRGSWGKLGNEAALDPANSFTTFASSPGSSSYDFNGSQTTPDAGFYLNRNGNPVGTWEKNVTTNIGFDATLFKGTTDIVFDWYSKKTEGLLYNPEVQGIMGSATTPFRNVGNMENHGIDLMISNRANLTRDLRLMSTLTFTTYKNKINAIADGLKFFDINSPANENLRLLSNITRNFVGQPFNTFYGYKVIGLFQNAAEVTSSPKQADAAPGRFKYADIDGDKEITDKDRTIIGNPNPKFTYGLNLGLEYKNFDLSMFFYGVAGKDAFNMVRSWTDFSPGQFPGGRSKRALYESWLPDGSRPNATVPIQEVTSGGAFSSYQNVNSYYIEDASFFRMRNLQIGYNIPMSIASKAKMSKARIYVQATNLFTVTKYSGLDPDFIVNTEGAAGIDNGAYPTVKQYLVGVNINF